MPKFLEDKLKKEYGEDSDVPYKIMNKLGFMRGSKITAKGKKAEEKHEKHKGKEVDVEVGGKKDSKVRGEILDKYLKKGK